MPMPERSEMERTEEHSVEQSASLPPPEIHADNQDGIASPPPPAGGSRNPVALVVVAIIAAGILDFGLPLPPPTKTAPPPASPPRRARGCLAPPRPTLTPPSFIQPP